MSQSVLPLVAPTPVVDALDPDIEMKTAQRVKLLGGLVERRLKEDWTCGGPLAEVCGYGTTCDAYHRVRLDESGEEPARAMTEALADAGIGAGDVDYVQYHGTSTLLNDRIETRATKMALGDAAAGIPGSSVKSQIGHPQGASGAAGMAATILGMLGGFVPPTINLETPDPACDLDYVPNAARPAEIEFALCNGIAFGSKNSALVLKNGRAL